MTPKQLLRIVRRLPASTPIADTIKPPARYKTHKEHWIGWLSEYDGPGFYGRKNPNRDARYIWNHIQNVGMLIWLAEAVGVSPPDVARAYTHSLPDGRHAFTVARQCKAARRAVPWLMVEGAMQRGGKAQPS